jgi:ectoine hydroxylase-related dioxygenase (phytanoyl-CoA dioxygenase family)
MGTSNKYYALAARVVPNVLSNEMTEQQVDTDGFAIVRGVADADICAQLVAAIGPIEGAGLRGLLSLAAVRQFASSVGLIDLLRPFFDGEPFPVRGLYFNKSSGANWSVAWHQDLSIAVRERREVPGFGPWSVKDGIPHVQPPIEVLERMVTVRLHLDDADEANGALKVFPGSHRCGRLAHEQIEQVRLERREVVCVAPAGSVMFMRPLLLHASGRVTSDRPRRVLHLEYAAAQLPGGLEWHAQNQL